MAQVETGKNFTLTLKTNGTVWEFGEGSENKPTQVKLGEDNLENIIDIGAGDSIKIVLNNTQEVYTWDLGENPKKVEGLKDIIAVDAYKDKFYAVDKERKYLYMANRRKDRKN